MSEENKRVVRRYFEELDRRKGTPVDLCADSFTFYVAGFAPMNLEATKQFAAMFFNALPDLSHPLERVDRGGRESGVSLQYEGTHTAAEFMGIQASGRRTSITGVGVMRVTNEQVAEFWVSPDRMTLMQQIGALPSEHSAP